MLLTLLSNLNLQTFENILKVLGVYGIVQILAQDLGIKTGQKQRDLIQSIPFQIIILYAGAFTASGGEHNIALMATGLYYLLKYVLSEGKTSNVCFEEV
jgi:hypothetical protein